MQYHLKIFYVDADESRAPYVREVEPAGERRCNWISTTAMYDAIAESVVIVRIRASWSTRG